MILFKFLLRCLRFRFQIGKGLEDIGAFKFSPYHCYQQLERQHQANRR